MRDAREFAAAIALLRRHLEQHPEDVRAARLLAETLYWSGDIPGARRAYQEAEARHPGDATLRLEHARMLVQLNEGAAASELLLPLREVDQTAADAEALLGTLAHWRGDLASARRHFGTALRHLPGHADAERGLAQIREATAPWVQTAVRSYRDDQPVSRMALVGTAAIHVSPLHAVNVHVEGDRFTAGETRAAAAGSTALRSYWPRARLQTEFGGGLRQGAPLERTEWTGRGALGLRVSPRATLTVAAEREAYLRTFASLLEPVMTASYSARLDWERPSGWLSQAAYSRTSYPDANVGHYAYGWIMAPLVRHASFQLRAGYAYAWEDTRESRFTPLVDPGPSPPGAQRPVPRGRGTPRRPQSTSPVAGAPVPGYYAPYYTPIDVRAHSLAAAVAFQASPRIAIRANGSYGVYARETALSFHYAAGSVGNALIVQSGWDLRRFTPLTARAALEAGLTRGVELQIEIEHMQTAHWRGTQISSGLRYRFLPTLSQR